ncbi:hypothetical protein J5751_04315 [bacterium]|nr:hypothetical protein [bacterium]
MIIYILIKHKMATPGRDFEAEYYQHKDVVDANDSLTQEQYKSCMEFINELENLEEDSSVERPDEDELNQLKDSVTEKYSIYVIEHLDEADLDKKTFTDQIAKLTPELAEKLLDKV